jgi:hypothetical protein
VIKPGAEYLLAAPDSRGFGMKVGKLERMRERSASFLQRALLARRREQRSRGHPRC